MNTFYRTFFLLICLLLTNGASNVLAQNYGSLVTGVSTVWTSGLSSSLFPYNDSATPIVIGNPNTASYPSIFALASVSGAGRAVGLAHENVLGNNDISQYNNLTFALNIFNWLDINNTNQIVIASGHGEWLNYNNATTLRSNLQSNGYTVTNLTGSITAAALTGKGVLMIGNGWQTYTIAEKLAIQNYVQGGGGLLMLGLGWSWVSYNSGGLAAYPMNQIGSMFGLYWTDTNISDATNQANGQPLFATFYPASATAMTVGDACSQIESITATYPTNLPDILQNNATVRNNYITAHLFMKETVKVLPTDHPLRQEVFDCYQNLINTYPTYFKKGIVYSSSTQNNFAWIRERVHRTYADALPLTPSRIAQIGNTLGLSGRYWDIWTNFTVLLADNSALDTDQKEYLYKLYSAVPPVLHNLRLMSFADELGTPPTASFGAIPTFLTGTLSSINSFSNTIGTYPENQFPSEVSAGVADIFCSAAPHEVNHIVDYYYIQGNTTLKNRKTQLISQAGTDNMNYLRSTLDSGFFVANPQEFIASIANEYFVDSKKTLDLALIRYNSGRTQPLNQFLYFADLYSQNSLYHTRFYTCNANCNFSYQQVAVGRDANNRLNSICYNNTQYNFTLDNDGNVTGYTTSSCNNCSNEPIISGNIDVCTNSNNTYTTAAVAGATYQWIVSGGVIVSGQGTNTVTIQWINGATPTLQVVVSQ